MIAQTISEEYAKIHFDEFLETIEHGPVAITRNGRTVIRLTKIEDESENELIEFGSISSDDIPPERLTMYQRAEQLAKNAFVNF